jgi:hypothetical protein
MPAITVNWIRPYSIPAGVVIGWHGTHAGTPQGWPRDTSLDGVFPKQIATSVTAPGATGGATTHVHPFQAHSAHTTPGHAHPGSWGTSPIQGSNSKQNGLSADIAQVHSHTSSSTGASDVSVGANGSPANTDTFANDPLHVTTIFLKSNGSPAGIPVGGIVWFNGATPAGFGAVTALDDRLMKGAATAANGGTQAGTDPSSHTHTTAAHSHALTAHTHTVKLDTDSTASNLNGPNVGADINVHDHALGASSSNSGLSTDAASETTGVGAGDPPWQKMRAITKTGNAGLAASIIAMWTGTLASIPAGWRLCDGTSGTPNLSQGKYVKSVGTGAVGDLGGATTHTHAGGTAHLHTVTTTHNHTFTGASGIANPAGTKSVTTVAAAQGLSPASHTHGSATYTAPTQGHGTTTTQATAQSANTSNDPVFVGVAYIQLIQGV